MHKYKSFRFGSIAVGFDRHELLFFTFEFSVCFQHPELRLALQGFGLVFDFYLYDGKTDGKDLSDETGK